jgi:hypothetical protein
VNFVGCVHWSIIHTIKTLREGSKLMGYPGGTIDRGARTFFEKKKIGGGKLFFRKIFFTTKFENSRFHFSKKAILKIKK